MNIKPVTSPHAVQQANVNHQYQNDAKARAVAKLMGQAPQAEPSPVLSQNAVTPEELPAITGQNHQTETPAVTETAPAPTPEPQVSSELALLARKEKAHRAKVQQQEAKFKQREAELKAREDALANREQTPQFDPTQYVPKARLKEAPLDVLAEEGLSYDELTQQLINAPAKNPRYEALVSKLEAKITQLEASLNKQVEQQNQQQTAARQAAIAQIAKDVNSLVKTDPNYETIRATRSQKDVVELIERTYDETGDLMTVEEAAQEVENYLVDEAFKLAQLEKIKKRMAPAPAASKPTDTQPPNQKQPQPMKTLTNANSSTRKLSARERAIKRFNGEII